jgi:uncharacterized protein
MKSSQYNILIENSALRESILFNTLYGSLTVWDKSEFIIVKHLLDKPETEIKDEKTKFIMFHLIEGKYLIDDKIDEIKIVENRKIAGMKDRNRLDVTIMPNMTCNFACTYCYESHTPSSFMNNKTEESIKRWLRNEIPKYKVLLLNWFGGEPLLSYKQIISIGRFAKEMCEKFCVGFTTNITTNGYLLNESRINELVMMEFFNFQITVDGPPEIHNQTRILKSGKDSFQKIFDNILLLARADKKVKISLRVNFNHHNFMSIPELLDLFPIDVRQSLRVVYEPIFGDKYLSAMENIPTEDISSTMTEYYRLAKNMGYDVVLGSTGTGKLVYCYAERENQFVINYNGDIFKCSVCDFNSGERFGFLNSKGNIVFNEKEWTKWFGMDVFEKKCYSCKFLPLCMGGCRKTRLDHADTGGICRLVPTNTSFVLKMVALERFEEILRSEHKQNFGN